MAVVSPAPAAFDVGGLGQVFTPPAIVEAMLALVRNRGRVLEPACGDGAFLQHFPFSPWASRSMPSTHPQVRG
jgi:hypothetical protein